MLHIWKHPESYFGFSPDGDILVLSMHRESDALGRTNWDAAAMRLIAAAGIDRIPDLSEIEGHGRFNGPPRDMIPAIYEWEASSSLIGWIRYLMVRADAPEAVLAEAQSIADDLAGYPSLDEDAWSELEYEEATELWASLPVRDRAAMIRDWSPETSIFEARRPWIPNDPYGTIYEHLRG